MSLEEQTDLHSIERTLFTLYRTQEDKTTFADLTGFFGGKYPLLAYLMFIKDRSRYLPIRPTKFDAFFANMGVRFTTSHACSWHNYSIYLDLMAQVKTMLGEVLEAEVTLLDAHSFAWITSGQMVDAGVQPSLQDYNDLSESERDAVVKARRGQGRFRSELLRYWSDACAVTNCAEPTLLKASHIKPWVKSSLLERTDVYNGLLLSPNLDAAFDSGHITFDEDGVIVLSPKLTKKDAEALGFHEGMRLRRMDDEHRGFLAYHRQNIFRDS